MTPPAASPGDDVALVARVAAGDAEALGALYDRHGGGAYALALAMLRDHADADDAVAGAFEQLWRSASTFDPSRGSVAAWLTMMTRSRALDLLRAQRRRAAAVERAMAERTAGDDPSGVTAVPLGAPEPADAAVERGELAQAVRASLATLPDAQRAAIELAFFGGLSHADVAATLGQPLGTVKTRIRDGMRKLRDALRPHWRGAA
ncbi:sigma-70 family RNA polymerase sigma factor [Roseisolibacter agri]|uniref:sigma-70 family RNA polymerase sigma factor n=1 Tax=Roseisolibacter agri TaxID=2014610 RepID=UPI0024E06DB9|nr:sigma-70 family RNA polymerase sigma factor [Roseisolibacter agri]